MDDQLSSTSEYTQGTMSSDLSDFLAGPAREDCLQALRQHLLWTYPKDKPYSIDDQKKLLSCLNTIKISIQKQQSKKSILLRVATSLAENISRDFTFDRDDVGSINARDRAMFNNYLWIKSRLHKTDKLLVWAATEHLIDSDQIVAPIRPFGWYVASETSDKPKVVGFGILGGDFGRHSTKSLSAAPEDSLEAIAFRDTSSNTLFESRSELERFGKISARVFGDGFTSANWSTFFEGLVLIREDKPVALLRRND